MEILWHLAHEEGGLFLLHLNMRWPWPLWRVQLGGGEARTVLDLSLKKTGTVCLGLWNLAAMLRPREMQCTAPAVSPEDSRQQPIAQSAPSRMSSPLKSSDAKTARAFYHSFLWNHNVAFLKSFVNVSGQKYLLVSWGL